MTRTIVSSITTLTGLLLIIVAMEKYLLNKPETTNIILFAIFFAIITIYINKNKP